MALTHKAVPQVYWVHLNFFSPPPDSHLLLKKVRLSALAEVAAHVHIGFAFAGAFVLIVLYGFLLYSIWRTAFYAAEPLGRYIAVGIGCVMIYHIFVNIGMSIGVAPVTGVPLPFVSYGGSFMLTVMASCGVLQSIYRHRRVEL